MTATETRQTSKLRPCHMETQWWVCNKKIREFVFLIWLSEAEI